MLAQVEQGTLLDLLAHTQALHQAKGEIGLACCAAAGLGAANKHTVTLAAKIQPGKGWYKLLWHYMRKFQCANKKINGLAANCGDFGVDWGVW